MSDSCDPVACGPLASSVSGILREEYWSGLPFSPPGDLPDPGIEPVSLECPALAGGFFTTVPLLLSYLNFAQKTRAGIGWRKIRKNITEKERMSRKK